MAPEKVTKMVLDVDLKCDDCYKKVKKVICKIPEIRDQEYDVEKNKVKITVICCSPERIRDKLCYKGGSSIQKIEIVEKAKEPEKPKSKPKDKDDGGKAKGAEKPKDSAAKPKGDEKPKPAGDKDKDKDKEKAKGDAPKKSDAAPKAEVAKMMYEAPVHGYPQMYPPAHTYPMVGYGSYEGYGGAVVPYQPGYGMPVASQPSASGSGYGYGYHDHGYHGNPRNAPSGDYFSEENPQGCSVM